MQNKLDVLKLECVRQQKKIFTELSFTVNEGEVLIVEGPNGSGKSSLLRLLATLMAPDAGEIKFNQQPITEMKLAYWQKLHYLGHVNGLKLALTIRENLCFTENMSGSIPGPSQYEEILSQLQLSAHAHTPIRELSAGQKRRVALAKLMLFPKLIWILDEPLTGLDKTMQKLFLEWLTSHLREHGLCILSSHHSLELPGAKFLRFKSC